MARFREMHIGIPHFFNSLADKYLSLSKWQRRGVVATCGTLIVALILPFIFFDTPNQAHAALTTIRQEINIIDGPVSSISGVSATSSETVLVDPAQYNGATFYFEVVASTTSATNATISLVNASTGAVASTITVNGTSYARYRSTSFTPGSATEYRIRTGSEAVGKGAIAARVVVLQNSNPITNTETQIEIGSDETYTSSATSTFASPKYWKYDSSKWDGSPTFYAEVTYQLVTDTTMASSTTYSTAGTFTVAVPPSTTSTIVELWGGGGAGGSGTGTTGGGAGGAGGQYAKKTIAGLGGTSKTLVVAATTAGGTGNGSQGATSTWDGAVAVAGGGNGGLSNSTASTTGNSSGCTGDTCFAGGTSGAGLNITAGYGGGGGGGAGSTGAGGSATGAGVAGTGTSNNPGGNGAAKCTKSTAITPGNTGSQAGGGGGGGCSKNNGGGGTGNGGTGAQGYAIVTDTLNAGATTTIALQEDNGSFAGWTTKATIVGAGSATSPTRVRSSAFTPTTGRNYRIVFNEGYAGATHAIFNAKIVVDQTSPTILEAQYLLANAKLASGTGLQKFLTSWDASEWAGSTNTYIHEVDSANGSASVVEVDTSGGTQVSGSVVSSPSNRAQSSNLTMPATGNLDVKATTNNNDIYASRILVQVSPDSTAPSPSPMTFAVAPAADSTSQISMTASTATDTDSPPVQYYLGWYSCGGSDDGTGGTDSSWQSGTTYSDAGLQPNQCYGYQVQARDSAGTPNYTASSSLQTIYTLANTPGTPTLTSPTSYTLALTNAENSNPALNPTTNFAVQITVTSGTDAAWNSQWVDATGNPSSSAVWLTDAQLDTIVLQGLQPSTTYQAQSKARNQNSIETALSTGGSGTTNAPPPPSNSPNEVIIRGGTRLRGGVKLR